MMLVAKRKGKFGMSAQEISIAGQAGIGHPAGIRHTDFQFLSLF
jgi:hypothetical protein